MSLVGQIAELQNLKTYKELSWEGSFEDYLELVRKNPHVTRNAYQRLYDMVLSHGVEEYIDNKKKLVRYKFFRDEAHGDGTERRIILLHGPVGSAKSTIARQLKKGLEDYSRTPDGALYTYFWTLPGGLSDLAGGQESFPSPMHDEPLRLIPREWREETIARLKLGTDDFKLKIDGDV